MSAEEGELGSSPSWWPSSRPQTSSFPLAAVAAEWWVPPVMVEIVSLLSASAGTRAGANIMASLAPEPSLIPVAPKLFRPQVQTSSLFFSNESAREELALECTQENSDRRSHCHPHPSRH